MFEMGDLDALLMNRLAKRLNENQFTYLFDSYERLEGHIVAKMKGHEKQVEDMKLITARYFVNILTMPEMFEIVNDTTTYWDLAEAGTNFMNVESLVMNQWILPQWKVGPETLGSD